MQRIAKEATTRRKIKRPRRVERISGLWIWFVGLCLPTYCRTFPPCLEGGSSSTVAPSRLGSQGTLGCRSALSGSVSPAAVGHFSLSGRRRLARSRVTQVWLAGCLDCRSVVSGSVSPTGVGHLSLSGRRRLAHSRAKQGWASLFMQTACARWPEAPRDRVTKTQTFSAM